MEIPSPSLPRASSARNLSPDGQSVAVRGPDGKRGIWPLEGGEFHPIPGLESGYGIIGWTPDGESVYVAPIRRANASREIREGLSGKCTDRENGAVENLRGRDGRGSLDCISPPVLSSDGSAYAYLYGRVLSEAYVVTGLK